MANILYEYDAADGETLIIESNNAIYLGNHMIDSLMNPIQAKDHGAHVDVQPTRYYPNDWATQQVIFKDSTTIPIKYDGVLPYLPIRRPPKEEIHNCWRLPLNSRDPWDPFTFNGHFSAMSHDMIPDYDLILFLTGSYDPVFSHLHSKICTQ